VGNVLVVPADCASVSGHRKLFGRGAIFSRIPDEEVGVSGKGELDGELGAVWTVSRVAGAADLADDWPHPDVLAFDEIAEGFVGDGGIPLFCEHVDGVRHLVKRRYRTSRLGASLDRKRLGDNTSCYTKSRSGVFDQG